MGEDNEQDGSRGAAGEVSRGREAMITRALLAAILSLSLTTSAWAGFDEGWAAYERGDYATAFEEWLPVAERGDATAQYNLGLFYAKDRGSPAQLVLAHMWLSLAAPYLPDAKRAKARKVLDAMQERMTAARIDEARRLAREWRPKGKVTE